MSDRHHIYVNEFHCVTPVTRKIRCPKVLVFVKYMRNIFVTWIVYSQDIYIGNI